MKKWFSSVIICIFVIAISGCCTIMSGRMQSLPIQSEPTGATVTVNGTTYTTPATVQLDRKASFYEIKVEMPGFEPQIVTLYKTVNGWVFGNIVLGGIIGIIVDVSTGAASKFTPSELDIKLMQKQLNSSRLNNQDILFVKLKK